MAQALTDTAAPNTATPEAVGSVKINSNRALPTEGQAMPHILPVNPDSDVTPEASFGGSDGNSEYIELTGNFPAILAITPDLIGHAREL